MVLLILYYLPTVVASYLYIVDQCACCLSLSLNVYLLQLLEILAIAVQIYYNYTGQSSCLDVKKDSTDTMGEIGWDFQV